MIELEPEAKAFWRNFDAIYGQRSLIEIKEEMDIMIYLRTLLRKIIVINLLTDEDEHGEVSSN